MSLPELALIRFVVLDDDFIGDGFIAQFTMPIECLQTGKYHPSFRSVFFSNASNRGNQTSFKFAFCSVYISPFRVLSFAPAAIDYSSSLFNPLTLNLPENALNA